MTAFEVYDLTTKGGGTDFGRVISICEAIGPYCLIGGLAANCYVEPVYTLDADLVIVSDLQSEVAKRLEQEGFTIRAFGNSINAQTARSDLRVQFTTDERYQDFPTRSQECEILGITVRVARLEDVVQDKLWAYADPNAASVNGRKMSLI